MRQCRNFNIKKSVFSNGSSGGDLVSPAVFQGTDEFRKTSALSLRWWWGENSEAEMAFQEDPQRALKNRLNSCFLKSVTFLVPSRILSIAFLKSDYMCNLKYCICSV